MIIVSCIDEQWGIGKNGDLLERIPEDLKNFKKITSGNVVIMGRKTFESIGKPLPNRINVVLTRDFNFEHNKTIVCNSIRECIKESKKINKEIFIIGGSEIYQQFLSYCDKAYITKIYNTYNADTFMVNLDNDLNWEKNSQGEIKKYKNIQYQFNSYSRIKGEK